MAWGEDEFAPGTGGGFNQGQDLIGPSGSVIEPPAPMDPPADRTWGQQFGDWFGISDTTQGKLASAAKELKSGLASAQQIIKLADPNAPQFGQQRVGQMSPPPLAAGRAPSLEDVLQQLLQRRQQLGQLGLQGRAYTPRAPGGLLGM
jgi:hypothetical protein